MGREECSPGDDISLAVRYVHGLCMEHKEHSQEDLVRSVGCMHTDIRVQDG